MTDVHNNRIVSTAAGISSVNQPAIFTHTTTCVLHSASVVNKFFLSRSIFHSLIMQLRTIKRKGIKQKFFHHMFKKVYISEKCSFKKNVETETRVTG